MVYDDLDEGQVCSLNKHFIMHTLTIPHQFFRWTGAKKMLWDFGQYWHGSNTQLLQIHDANLLFHHNQDVLY